jgi:hypothetical protein
MLNLAGSWNPGILVSSVSASLAGHCVFSGTSPMGRTVGVERRKKKRLVVNASLLQMT